MGLIDSSIDRVGSSGKTGRRLVRGSVPESSGDSVSDILKSRNLWSEREGRGSRSVIGYRIFGRVIQSLQDFGSLSVLIPTEWKG